MTHDRGGAPGPERRGIRLAAKLMGVLVLASAILLVAGALGWRTLRSASQEIRAAQLAPSAATDSILNQIDKAGWELAAGAFLAIALLSGLYLYFIRSIVRPLQANARIMSRLAVGDSSEDTPAGQLARDDEIGDMTRALQDLIAYQREETAIANDMSAGDFTGAVAVRDSADALGMAIQRMARVIGDTLKHVNAHTGRVMTGCEAVASAGRQLSANSGGITDSVAEISTGIDRIRTHADGNASAAEQMGKLSGSGSQSIERGYEDVGEMGIVMLNMQACGDKIVRIAKSIGDIAFQTNLLALNASVEAARAGRHGKGFTIVAEEVRSLAGRTRKAAEETSSLMQETVEQVELAAAIAGRINATFSLMQDNIQEVDELLAKVAAASGEQSGVIEQISAALRRVDHSVRENMAHVGDVLEKTDGLVRQTGQLRQLMGRFNVGFGYSPDFQPAAGSGASSFDVRLPREVRRIGLDV